MYGYYFLFSVSSPGIDLGEIPENRGYISRRERGYARGNADITPLSSATFHNLIFRLVGALRMNL